MGFSGRQLVALRKNLDIRAVRTREANGRKLSYLEGWYVISEANRIFGFDGWSRETVDSRCVLTRESHGNFLAVYVARVRITIHANGKDIVREGHGTGEGRGTSAGEVHDTALKAAETDATKRALATFGKPFGLELYRNINAAESHRSSHPQPPVTAPPKIPIGFHPDDTTPIRRPSRFFGRRQDPVARDLALRVQAPGPGSNTKDQLAHEASLVSPSPTLVPGHIDKSALTISEPKRLRDKAHLKFVASQPCLVCGRQPCDPHHLRFAQPRAIGLKVSDEFTVPLCRGHHRQLHQVGNELAWWQGIKINALEAAKGLWEQTHPKSVTSDTPQVNGDSNNTMTEN